MPYTDPRYAALPFPDYQFREYPRWLGHDKYGADVIANNEDDVDALRKIVVNKVVVPDPEGPVRHDPATVDAAKVAAALAAKPSQFKPKA